LRRARDVRQTKRDAWLEHNEPNSTFVHEMTQSAREQMTIVIEAESPGDSRTLFRIRFGDRPIGEELTAVEAHLLVGEILARIALPKQQNTKTK
jgi:hypothetical protein